MDNADGVNGGGNGTLLGGDGDSDGDGDRGEDDDGGDINVRAAAAGQTLRREGRRPRGVGRAGRGGGGGEARVSSTGVSPSPSPPPPPPPDPRISDWSIASRELRADVDKADIAMADKRRRVWKLQVDRFLSSNQEFNARARDAMSSGKERRIQNDLREHR